VCTFTTGEGTRGETTHNVPHTTSVSVDSDVQSKRAGTTRSTASSSPASAAAPPRPAPCPWWAALPGNPGHGGVWTSVVLTGGEGGLYVNYGDQHVLIGG
jgi:hypothetical protein